MGQLIDRTGLRYGRLVVLGRDMSTGPASKGQRTKWLCVCDCGAERSVTGHGLAAGSTTSCGCFRDEAIGAVNRRHSLTRTPTYRSWQAAKERCYNQKADRFPVYGGRGIEMCQRWRFSFDAFLQDMGIRPEGMTLDRLDPNGNYELANCRWATDAEQASNRTKQVEWEGRSWTIKALASHVGVPRTSLNKLLKRGLPADEAIAHAIAHTGQRPAPTFRLPLRVSPGIEGG